MERMILVLQPDSDQHDALTALVAAQHDPESPQYQQWLTPESFGQMFGASERDVEQVVNWLQGHGFDVEPISPGRGSVVFSGTTAQVESAFHTEIHI
jgi:subtilase family serine protease